MIFVGLHEPRNFDNLTSEYMYIIAISGDNMGGGEGGGEANWS